MRKLLLAALLAAIPSIASAQVGYVEGSIGFVLVPDVETDDYSIFTPQGELFEGNGIGPNLHGMTIMKVVSPPPIWNYQSHDVRV